MSATSKTLKPKYMICAGYVFMNHKAQGQTLENIIVDVGTTNNFPVTPFLAYVVLSQNRGRDTIRLLRDFDETIFTKYCTISIYSVRPCDHDMFDGFSNSVLTIDYRDIKKISVDRVIYLVNLWVTPVNV